MSNIGDGLASLGFAIAGAMMVNAGHSYLGVCALAFAFGCGLSIRSSRDPK